MTAKRRRPAFRPTEYPPSWRQKRQPDRLIFWGLLLILTMAFLMAAVAAFAQDRHAIGHGEYMGWSSQKTGNCCNNLDCHYLEENEWRETERGAEVKIMGQWCAVEQQHFILTGKSPDALRAHACIREVSREFPKEAQCQRLLCFVGPAKS